MTSLKPEKIPGTKYVRKPGSHILLSDRTGPFGNISLERSSQDENIRQKLEHIFNRSKQNLRDCLQRGVDAGDEHFTGIDINATADAMYAYMEGILLFSKTSNDPEVIRRLAPAMLAIRIYPETH